MATLRLDKLKKTYGTLTVLHEISLAVEDGEFVALVGPSGCGKSTLLQLIAGLEDASGGRILIRDEEVNDRSPKDRNVAMVFQNYALYPHMTVAENMGFSLKLAGVSPAENAARVRAVAETLGISELLQRYPKQLSGGQRQRVAMGRAIVRDPDVFLFDEPLSNLDAKLRVQMRGEIKGLHQRLRTTTIYVTHDQVEAMTMADRIVVMQNGHIEQAGTPMELYNAPVNAFVAGFIGTPMMNFLAGKVEASNDDRIIFHSDGGAVFDLPPHARAAVGAKRILGIRPQHLRIVKEGAPAEVVMVEPTGAETHLHLSVAADKVMCVANGHTPLQPGMPVAVQLDHENVYIFDSADGRRIPVGGSQAGKGG